MGVGARGKKNINESRCHAAKLPTHVDIIVKQEGRCQAWIDRMSAATKSTPTKDKQVKFAILNANARSVILKSINPAIAFEADLAETLSAPEASPTKTKVALMKAKAAYTKKRIEEMDTFDKRVEEGKVDAIKKGKLRAAFKHLKIRDFAPMLYLKELVSGK